MSRRKKRRTFPSTEGRGESLLRNKRESSNLSFKKGGRRVRPFKEWRGAPKEKKEKELSPAGKEGIFFVIFRGEFEKKEGGEILPSRGKK